MSAKMRSEADEERTEMGNSEGNALKINALSQYGSGSAKPLPALSLVDRETTFQQRFPTNRP
jgi:hypothetical protein